MSSSSVSSSVPGFWVGTTVSRRSMILAGLVIAVPVVMLFSLNIGALSVDYLSVLQVVLHKIGLLDQVNIGEAELVVVWSVRIPRILLGTLAGAVMGICGASLQGLFRNPLAEPTLVGVTGGAAFAAVATIYLGQAWFSLSNEAVSLFALPVAAFIGGLVVTFLVYLIATYNGYTNMATMLLAGIALNALASAGIGYFVFSADDHQMRTILFWTMGSLGGSLWQTLLPIIPFFIITIAGLLRCSAKLNLYLLGEYEARHLGVNTQRLKLQVVVFTALGIGAAVSVSGMIGFVGLVAPHILRLMGGADHKWLLPASALFGSVILLLSDTVARTIVAPAELPIGLITSLVGAPFFLYLLLLNRKREGF